MTAGSVLSLDRTETVLWSTHPRLFIILPDALVGTVLVAAGLGIVFVPEVSELSSQITPWLGAIAGVGVAIPAWSYIVVVNTLFVITDRALYVKRGVFRKRVDRIDHNRVQNSATTQGIRGKLLNYGTVSVDTAGISSAIRFYNINNPRAVRERIDSLAGEPDETGIPGSVEQWTAILEELKALRAALESR